MTPYDDLLVSLKREFPRLSVRRKRDCVSQRLIHTILWALTLGKMRTYLDHYQTTLGQTLYITDSFACASQVECYITLRHEAVHLRQFRKYGYVLMGFLYLFVPLPVFLAYFRCKMEQEAYEETLQATYEVFGKGALLSPHLRTHIVNQFTSASYGYMWPFPRAIAKWYDAFVCSLLEEDQRPDNPSFG